MPPQDLEKIFRGANPLGMVSPPRIGLVIISRNVDRLFIYFIFFALPCTFFVSVPVQPLTCWSACWFWIVMEESRPARLFPTRTSHSTMIRTTSPRPNLMTKRWRAKIEPWGSGKVEQRFTWLNDKKQLRRICASHREKIACLSIDTVINMSIEWVLLSNVTTQGKNSSFNPLKTFRKNLYLWSSFEPKHVKIS